MFNGIKLNAAKNLLLSFIYIQVSSEVAFKDSYTIWTDLLKIIPKEDVFLIIKPLWS